MATSKKVLLVSYHFPPYSGGSGVLRASKFVRYLPEHGWTPHVLTTSSNAYERIDPKARNIVSPDVPVARAFTLDAQRQLAFRGRYIGWTALPDRWANWAVTGIPLGLQTIYRNHIDVILVTFPIASAALIGWALHRITGKPLVMDFRDSMTEDNYPTDPRTWRIYRWIEKRVVESASRLIFTTRSTREMYLKRYPALSPSDCIIIGNGFDEEDFEGILPEKKESYAQDRPLRLVHSGLIYPEERDPRPFFRALKRLKAEGRISASSLSVDLRASGSEDYYAGLLQEYGIADIVHLLAPMPHRDSLRDTATADALLLFQAASCNHQIPAKIYEYLKFERPILALTSVAGDTAALLRDTGGATIADLADEESIYKVLPEFIAAVGRNAHSVAPSEKVSCYTRRTGTKQLAYCLDQLLPRRNAAPASKSIEGTSVSGSN